MICKNSTYSAVNNHKFIIIIMYVMMASIIVWATSNVLVFCFLSAGLMVLGFWKCQMDIACPLVCYFPFFVLYTCSYPLLKYFGYEPNVRGVGMDITAETIYISWVALATMFIALCSFKYDKLSFEIKCKKKPVHKAFVNWGFWISLGIAVIYYFYILRMGLSSKIELRENANLLSAIGIVGMKSNIIFAMLSVLAEKRKYKKIILIGLAILNSILAVGFTGERDVIICVLFLVIMWWKYEYNIGIGKIILLLIPIFIFIAFSSSVKMFIATGDFREVNNEIPIWVSFLQSDFSSAGFNLNNLIYKKDIWDFWNGKSLIYDFLSPIDDFIPNLSELSSAKWNQNFFWPTSRTGLGFTIIGEGYLNFGICGVVLWMIIMSFLIKRLYRFALRNDIAFVVYCYGMALCIYTSRGGMASLISPLVKYAFLIYLLNSLLCRKGIRER